MVQERTNDIKETPLMLQLNLQFCNSEPTILLQDKQRDSP